MFDQMQQETACSWEAPSFRGTKGYLRCGECANTILHERRHYVLLTNNQLTTKQDVCKRTISPPFRIGTRSQVQAICSAAISDVVHAPLLCIVMCWLSANPLSFSGSFV